MAGQKVKVNCSVEYISFSAHTDFKQSIDVILKLIQFVFNLTFDLQKKQLNL